MSGTNTSLRLKKDEAPAPDAMQGPPPLPVNDPMPPPAPVPAGVSAPPPKPPLITKDEGRPKSRAGSRILTTLLLVVLFCCGFVVLKMYVLGGDEVKAASFGETFMQLFKSNPKSDSALKAWPAIEVTGAMAGTSSRPGSAILNGQFIQINGQLKGVTVLEIQDGGVWLGFEGEEKYLMIGENTTQAPSAY